MSAAPRRANGHLEPATFAPPTRTAAVYRPRWWPPACSGCAGFGYIPQRVSETWERCEVCAGTGHAVTHRHWTALRVAIADGERPQW